MKIIIIIVRPNCDSVPLVWLYHSLNKSQGQHSFWNDGWPSDQSDLRFAQIATRRQARRMPRKIYTDM
jgi:hypothetical protein